MPVDPLVELPVEEEEVVEPEVELVVDPLVVPDVEVELLNQVKERLVAIFDPLLKTRFIFSV